MDTLRSSKPRTVNRDQWHLPFIEMPRDNDIHAAALPLVSAARCARVSYLTHNGERDWHEDLRLYRDLVNGNHMSPLEHPCTPYIPINYIGTREQEEEGYWNSLTMRWEIPNQPPGNFDGWWQLRHHPDRHKLLKIIDAGL